ncbi:MAG TPA: glycoside hydrolase domain-containing protein [Silvibacterium sp.]|nr:glycoside hydrolase domain-containing protein [Silvibacterium sp.]
MLRTILTGLVLLATICAAQNRGPYLGFDKNNYPGDDLLPTLHRTFAYTGFWLNNPPGMTSNPWASKRAVLQEAGFGFLILFNGRLDSQLKGQDAIALGTADAKAAVRAVQREGFPSHVLIFIDQEEGGRLLPEQAAYLDAWFAGVVRAGLRAGIYCSGIDVEDGKSVISTSKDIAARFPEVKQWIFNDQCPPSPGCVAKAGNPAKGGIENALVWQFAQSPRSQFAVSCKVGYAADNNCYAPGLSQSDKTMLDMNTSNEADPSVGR